jgi:hypothetical protein
MPQLPELKLARLPLSPSRRAGNKKDVTREKGKGIEAGGVEGRVR